MKILFIRCNFISLEGHILNTSTLIIKILDGKWLPVHWAEKYLKWVSVEHTRHRSTLSSLRRWPDFLMLMAMMKSINLKDFARQVFFTHWMPETKGGPRASFFFKIDFIGVTLVNKIIYVPGVQFHNTPSVYCIVCSPPQVKSPATTIYAPFAVFYPLPPPFPSGNHHVVVFVFELMFCFLFA